MPKTIFEHIIDRHIPAHIVYEDEYTIAILDIKPKVLGHVLVIPKKVSRTILEMNPSDIGLYFEVVQKVAQAVQIGTRADGLNIVINVEAAGNQEVFHTHTHIIPRHQDHNISLDPGTHVAYSSPDQMNEYTTAIKASFVS